MRGNVRGGEVDGMKETKKSGERGMSNCCARYHEVDLMLTLYVETGRGCCSQLAGVVAGSEAQHGHRNGRLERDELQRCLLSRLLQAEDWTGENKGSDLVLNGWH